MPLALPVVAVILFIAASTAPTPIYPLYQAEWAFPPVTTTVIFSVYCLSLLASLLTVGALADHVGRRPVLLGAVAVQFASVAVFALAGGVPALIVARVLQGLATGAAMGALSAAMLDADPRRGPLWNSVGPIAGTAVGPLAASLLVEFVPLPLRTPYLVLLVAFALLGIAIWRLPSHGDVRRPGALASLKPSVHVPARARRALLVATPITVAAWAMGGFYLSLGPAMIRMITGSSSSLVAGVITFVVPAAGAVTVVLLRRSPGHVLLVTGTSAMLGGALLTVVSMAAGQPVLFFVSAVLAGVGFGAGFQGAVRTVLPLAAPAERAGLASALYVITYSAMGAPSVLAGQFVGVAGLAAVAEVYSGAVALLAGSALVAALLARRRVPVVA